MRIRALIGTAVLLLLAGCGPGPEVEIREGLAAAIEPSATATPAPERSLAVSDSDTEPDFILNPSTLRFHLPGCAWAQRIAEDRRIEYAGGRETLIEVGYQPCRYCKP